MLAAVGAAWTAEAAGGCVVWASAACALVDGWCVWKAEASPLPIVTAGTVATGPVGCAGGAAMGCDTATG